MKIYLPPIKLSFFVQNSKETLYRISVSYRDYTAVRYRYTISGVSHITTIYYLPNSFVSEIAKILSHQTFVLYGICFERTSVALIRHFADILITDI